MTQVLSNNLNRMMRYKENIFTISLISLFFLISGYIFFVHSIIVNTIEREKITKEIREKSTAVSYLESTYIAEKNKVNIELAHSKGFKDSEVASYISKKSLTAFIVHNEL